MVAGPTRGPHPQRALIVATATLFVVLIAAGFFLVLHSFNSEAGSESRAVDLGVTTGDNPNPPPEVIEIPRKSFSAYGFEGTAQVVEVNTTTNQMTVRISLGSDDDQYVNTFGDLLQPLKLSVPADTGSDVIDFPAGAPIPVTDLVVNLTGTVTDYPFDTYHALFTILLENPNAQVVPTHGELPVLLHLTGAVHGLTITLQPPSASQAPSGLADYVEVSVHRASSVLFFSIFLMVLFWALSLAGVAMALMLTLLRRAIGAGVLCYLAVLMFAFPQIRNSMPGVPAVGAKVDYLSFLWAEVIVGITLLALGVLWIVRETRSAQVSDGGSEASEAHD